MRQFRNLVCGLFFAVLPSLGFAQQPASADPLANPSQPGFPVDPATPVKPAPVAPAQQPAPAAVVQPAPASMLLPTAPEFRRIYDLMMATRRFQNGVGHTVAASQLAACLPGLTPEQKVQSLMAMLSALARSNLLVVTEAFQFGIWDDTQVTVIASVLACKAGNRNQVQMVQTLQAAYRELLVGYNLRDELYQVEVAARLMP